MEWPLRQGATLHPTASISSNSLQRNPKCGKVGGYSQAGGRGRRIEQSASIWVNDGINRGVGGTSGGGRILMEHTINRNQEELLEGRGGGKKREVQLPASPTSAGKQRNPTGQKVVRVKQRDYISLSLPPPHGRLDHIYIPYVMENQSTHSFTSPLPS